MPCLTNSERSKVKILLSSVKGSNLFCDTEFPATDESLFHEPDKKEKPKLYWKRPHEIVSKPLMFVDGASRADVRQGALGDCWFLASASAIATRPELIKQVIPEDQVLYGDGYTGLVTFRFWRMGTWVTINIDDRLPVDEDDDLFYAKCKDSNEFWLPLLEKAFAKFHGNYNYLNGGQLPEGFMSLTGYITEAMYVPTQSRKELFSLIRQEFRNGSVINCSRGPDERVGLVPKHAYAVTGAMRVMTKDEGLVRLVRVRNPWGKTEWVGAWDDSDSRWNKLDDAIKIEMEYHPDNDGEFWIKMAHFIKHFTVMSISTKIPEHDSESVALYKNLFAVHNAWMKGRTAGGSKQEGVEKFAINPQYLLVVKEPDDGEDCQPGEASDDEEVCKVVQTCNVIIELVQEHNRKKFPSFFPIAVTVFPYKKPKPYKRFTVGDLREIKELENSTLHIPMSSVVGRFSLQPGAYVIIPNTHEPDMCRDFLLRVYCRKAIMLKELW